MILRVLKRLDRPLRPAAKGQSVGGPDISWASASAWVRICSLTVSSSAVASAGGRAHPPWYGCDARSSPRCLGYTHATIVHTLSDSPSGIGVRTAIVTQLSVDVPIKFWALQGFESGSRFHTSRMPLVRPHRHRCPGLGPWDARIAPCGHLFVSARRRRSGRAADRSTATGTGGSSTGSGSRSSLRCRTRR